MILNATYKLINGVLIPKIGLGTWLMPDDQAEKAVKQAIEMGYRHIDTAQAYQNEEGVGRGLRASGVKRDELFVTSKIAAELKSHDEAAASIDESLSKLGLDTLDLMIIHAPQPWREFRGERRYFDENLEVWRALEEAYAEAADDSGADEEDKQEEKEYNAEIEGKSLADETEEESSGDEDDEGEHDKYTDEEVSTLIGK